MQLVSQVCGAPDVPVGDVQLTDPGLTEGDRDGCGGTPGTEEQDALARELYAGLLAGHHHGVYGTRDASFLLQLVH